MTDYCNNNITWNNLSAGTTTSNNTITFTTDGTDSGFSWYPNIIEDKDWLPYCYNSYEPKWHILLGYKTQMSNMWD